MSAASALALPLAPGQQLVHVREARSHRVLRETLQVQIERRVDLDRSGSVVVVSPGYSSSSVCPTKSTKCGASASSARCTTVSGSFAASDCSST